MTAPPDGGILPRAERTRKRLWLCIEQLVALLVSRPSWPTSLSQLGMRRE